MKRHLRKICIILMVLSMLLSSCGKKQETAGAGNSDPGQAASASKQDLSGLASASQMMELNGSLSWNVPDDKYRTCYEIFVYSFADSDGDGIGDLRGLLDRLDYINDGDPESGTDLGCNEIWLMPVCPSPTYHKYDVTDYKAIDPAYGTMEDFQALLDACHDRGIRVITDLVLNHTSVEHPWFAAAASYLENLSEEDAGILAEWLAGADRDPAAMPEQVARMVSECPTLPYYKFRREPASGYAPLPSGWYYEARFWEGMPDLDLSYNMVEGEITDIMGFWLEKGVDGFRLDAVTSYFTDENQKNIEFLSWLTHTARWLDPDVYLVGEAWVNQATYSGYYASGIDSLFDFDFAGQDGIIASVVKGSRKASWYTDALVKEEELYASINPEAVNAPFYTNHDMARSSGYYAYDDGSHAKLAQAMNLLMTGNAFLYYGEELGMKGSGRDENKRAPMYWISEGDTDADGLAAVMTAGPPEMEAFEMKYPSEAAQDKDPYSILNYCRNVIRIRNAFPVIARGRTEAIRGLDSDTVSAFTRTMPVDSGEQEGIAILINTGEESQTLDLSRSDLKYRTLAAVLTVSEEPVVLEGDSLTLPPFGIAVIKE